MATEIITKEDLDQFGEKLLNEIKSLLGKTTQPTQKWLKSAQVRSLLKISPGTLQNLRLNGTLTYKKIGGIFFYDYDELTKVLEGKAAVPSYPSNKREFRIRR